MRYVNMRLQISAIHINILKQIIVMPLRMILNPPGCLICVSLLSR